MITLFKRVREKLIAEGKARRYVLYAAGEILLVVIGILIALQVNNWNEERKEQLVEDQYLEQLRAEAVKNISQFERSASQFLDLANKIKKTAQLIENREPVPENLDSFQGWGLSPTFIHTWTAQTSVYDEIISTGSLRLVQDDTLKTLLGTAYKSIDYGYQQLQYWRQISVEDTRIFDEYKLYSYSPSEPDTPTRIYLDMEKLKDNPFAVKRLGYWGAVQMLFYEGLNGQANIFDAVRRRIDHIK